LHTQVPNEIGAVENVSDSTLLEFIHVFADCQRCRKSGSLHSARFASRRSNDRGLLLGISDSAHQYAQRNSVVPTVNPAPTEASRTRLPS
jgi:hypothetical protein